VRRHRFGLRALSGFFVASLLASATAYAEDLPDLNGSTAESVQAMQQRILSDPQAASAVQALRDDPDVQAVLNDPDVTKALASGDLAALMRDPKIQQLADKPAVQNLTRRVGQ
jgi:hypothetical protein